MKHFMDIEVLREFDTDIKVSNAKGFEVGDHIQITEKVDGSNASIQKIDGKLVAFSRKQQLDEFNTLDGFYDYVQTLDPSDFEDNYVVFGEWLRKNKIVYEKENMHKWYVYDIYDLEKEEWKNQTFVKGFAIAHHLIYVNVLYDGPFISWDHCRTFMNSPHYGNRQEGIVVKNQDKLNDPNTRLPFYLKLVNDDFKESKAPKVPKTAEELAAEAQAGELARSIITSRRIEKMIFALRDEGIFPEKIEPKDMKLVAQNLPKRVYEDCMKEEIEVVNAINALEVQPFSKICGSVTMQIARELICS